MKRAPLIILGLSLVTAGIGITVGKDTAPTDKKPVPAAAAGQPGAQTKPAAPDKKPQKTFDSSTSQGADKPSRGTDKSATKNSAAPERSADEPELSADEKAIRESGDAYVKAFAAGDAKGLAEFFTADAEYVDEHGNVHQGRSAIEEAAQACFAKNPGAEIDLNIDSIRFISAGVAVEDGSTSMASPNSSDPVVSRYSAVHVKSDGKWLVASVREHAPKNRRQHRSQLDQLSWMQGEWVDEDRDSVVAFACAPIDGGNFLLRNFRIHVAGYEAMTGSQRIGWDPLSGKLRTWIFDSEGGYGEGYWHRDGDRWVLKAIGVTAEGEIASNTSVYTMVDEHTMTWQSVDREVAGTPLPDSSVVTIVRRAPAPESIDEAAALLETK